MRIVQRRRNENIKRCEATENCKVRLFTRWGLTERNDCLIFKERKVEKGGEGEGKHTVKNKKQNKTKHAQQNSTFLR